MTIITSPTHALVFGATNLIGTDADVADHGYRLDALGTDADWGNPKPIEQKVISWLQDGAIVGLQGYDNRDLYLKVQVTAADDAGLAAGEAALMGETMRRNALAWTPPGEDAQTSVFSVVMSHLEQITDDQEELRYSRVYGLRIIAEPFVRAVDIVTVSQSAPTETQSFDTVDNCTSTSGWTAAWFQISNPAVGGTVTPFVASGGVRAISSGFPTGTPISYRMLRSGLTVDVTTMPYLRVEAFGNNQNLGFNINGQSATVAATNGKVRWIDLAALGITELHSVQVLMGSAVAHSYDELALIVNDISVSNVLGDLSSTMQSARTLSVAGSARTQGSLALEDEDNALGTALIYTCPPTGGMMQPPLRALLSSGPTPTPDATAVSGFRSDLSSTHTFDLPPDAVVPGGHLLLARIWPQDPGTNVINWTAEGYLPGRVLPGYESGTTSFDVDESITDADAAMVVILGAANLPVRRLGPGAFVRINVNSPDDIDLDEVWAFNIETGRLTWVECGEGTPVGPYYSNRLWIDAATIADPVPTVWLGSEADRSDAFHAADEMKSFGVHEFTPPEVNVFTVTTNAPATTLTLSHYPRFHTHVYVEDS